MTIQETFEKLSSDLRTWIRNNFLNHLTTKNIHRELIEITMDEYNKLGNKVNTDGKVYYIKDGASDVKEESSSILPIKNGGTGASHPRHALKNLGLYGVTVTGKDNTEIHVTEFEENKKNFVTIPLKRVCNVLTQSNYAPTTLDNEYFSFNDDNGGLRIEKNGYYMISGSVHMGLAHKADTALAKGAFIFVTDYYFDNASDTFKTATFELSNATECTYTGQFTSSISIAPKIVFLSENSTVYLKARAQKTTGTVYPGNLGTYLTIYRLSSD